MANKIVIIGSGNLATNLAYNFDLAGFSIDQVISRNLDHAKVLAGKYGAFSSSAVQDVNPEANFVFVCVPDDKITEVSGQIPPGFSGLVCHCSGSLPLDALASRGYKGVFYPLQTFRKEEVISMMQVPILVEGDSVLLENELAEVADRISNKVKRVDSQDRKKYHLSAVIANNFSNLMFVMAEEYLNENQLDFEIIRPLIRKTASNLKSGSPKDWQTGPAKRGDVETIKNHLKMLNSSEMKEIYEVLSKKAMTKL